VSRVGISTTEDTAAATASARLAVATGSEFLVRDQSAERLAMARLSAAFPPTGRTWRPSFQADRIGRRGLGGVCGIEFEAGFQNLDAAFQFGNALSIGRKDR